MKIVYGINDECHYHGWLTLTRHSSHLRTALVGENGMEIRVGMGRGGAARLKTLGRSMVMSETDITGFRVGAVLLPFS